MRLHSSSLPTLALFVDVVCLLMVVVLKSSVCVKLYNDCSSQNLAVDRKGRVYARDDLSSIYQNFTVKSKDFTGKLTLFGVESHRYLCFNKNWKLVGSRKYRGPACLFYEEMRKNGYTRYRSVLTDDDDEHRYLGFNKRGKFLKETRESELTSQQRKCLNFLKLETEFNINDHNRKVAGSHRSSSHHMKIRHKNHHRENLNEIT